MRRHPFLSVVLVLIVLPNLATGQKPKAKAKGQPKPLPELNKKVLEYCSGHVGKQVGNGDCNSLAVSALRESGAVIPAIVGPPDGDFAWGQLIATLTAEKHPSTDILPGDVLQFRDVKVVTISMRNGIRRTVTQEYGHHTAVVLSVSGANLRVLHSNVDRAGAPADDKKIVQEDPLPLNDIKRGTIWAYRPRSE